MSLAQRPVDELISIVKAGAGLRLPAGNRSVEDLVSLAETAAEWGAPLVLTGLSAWTAEDLIRVADAGQGTVVFED